MQDYTGDGSPAQPIRASFMRIMSHVIANSSPKSEQKELILIMHENDLVSLADVYLLMHCYGLRDA